MTREFKKFSEFASKHKVRLDTKSVQKLKAIMTGKEKPTPETLDKLALLAGFQDWQSLRRSFEL